MQEAYQALTFVNSILVPFTSHRKYNVITGRCPGKANTTINTAVEVLASGTRFASFLRSVLRSGSAQENSQSGEHGIAMESEVEERNAYVLCALFGHGE